MARKTLSATPLKTLLERVFLNGTMTECLLNVAENQGHIIALDMTNSVLVDIAETLPGLEDGQYGIGKLDTLVKFLGMCQGEELTYTIDEKWLTLRRKGHGKFAVLLLETDMVGTQTESDPEVAKNMAEYSVGLPLKKEFVDDALAYIGLASGQLVSFHVLETGRILFVNTTVEVERFEIPIGDVGPQDETFSIAVYSQQLVRVLNVLQIGDNAVLHLSKDRPVILEQDPTNVWALTNAVV